MNDSCIVLCVFLGCFVRLRGASFWGSLFFGHGMEMQRKGVFIICIDDCGISNDVMN